MCTRCSCKKKKADFCCSRSTNPLYEYSTCNKCHEKRKNTKKEIDLISRKKKKLEDNLILTTPILQPNSQIPFSHLTNLELNNIIQDAQYNNNVSNSDNVNNETDGVYDSNNVNNKTD